MGFLYVVVEVYCLLWVVGVWVFEVEVDIVVYWNWEGLGCIFVVMED